MSKKSKVEQNLKFPILEIEDAFAKTALASVYKLANYFANKNEGGGSLCKKCNFNYLPEVFRLHESSCNEANKNEMFLAKKLEYWFDKIGKVAKPKTPEMNDFIIHFAYASDDKTDECPVYCPSCLYYFSVFYSNKHLEKCKSLPTDTRETAEYLGDYLKEFVKNKRQKISKEQHDKTDDLIQELENKSLDQIMSDDPCFELNEDPIYGDDIFYDERDYLHFDSDDASMLSDLEETLNGESITPFIDF